MRTYLAGKSRQTFAGVALAALAVVVLAGVASAATGAAEPGADHGRGGQGCRPTPGPAMELETAKLIIEFNATDGDLGVHGLFDGDGWSELCVFDPSGARILAISPRQQLEDLTMASLFFESREPPLDEFSFDHLAAQFAEGAYRVIGTSFEGEALVGAALFTHDVPAPPVITAPQVTEEEDLAGDVVVATDNVTVEWEPVTETISGDPATIASYEVIVTKIEHEDPHGFSRPIYDVHVPPDVTVLEVPSAFFEEDSAYELEVLALEHSGNQTISLGFFTTSGD